MNAKDKKPVSRSRLLTLIKDLDWRSVKAALEENPDLVEYRGDKSANLLHLCCGIDIEKRGLSAADSIKTAGVLLEHFAVLKGLTERRARREIVDALLQQTNLYDVRKQKLGGYSGGMRQRFGVAVALLGNPKSQLERAHSVISTKLLGGRTVARVQSATSPGAGFDPVRARGGASPPSRTRRPATPRGRTSSEWRSRPAGPARCTS